MLPVMPNKRPGTPRQPNGEYLTKSVLVSVTPTERSALEALSLAQGQPLASIVRQALRAHYGIGGAQ